MIILVDQDEVLTGFESAFEERWRARYPQRFFVSMAERTMPDIEGNYPDEWEKDVRAILHEAGFVRSFKPIPGAIQALNDLKALGHDIFICTAPLSQFENCVLEKYLWVEEHMGRDWTKKIILTKDKTLVHGDMLIDDRPVIRGVNKKPSWEHILFGSNTYSAHITDRRRLATWQDWHTLF